MPTGLAEVAGQDLIWVQPKVSKPEYELRAATTVVTSLRGSCGECEGHSWTFKLEGWLRRRVTVQAPDPVADGAVFRWRRADGGTLDLPEGRILHIGVAQDSLPPRFDMLEPDGTPLVHFQTRAGCDASERLVEIEKEAATLFELPLLVVLGEYLAVLLAKRHGGAPDVLSVWDTLPSLLEVDS
jgi:hypothetical protein